MASTSDARTLPAWLPGLAVVLLAVAVHANTLGNGFTWDDRWLIVENPRIGELSYVKYMLFERDLWRPVKRMTFMLDHAIWGLDRPWGFHLTNLVLHALGCLLVVVTATRLGLSRAGALVAGVVLAVHPVVVESVANVSHRKELLALVFCLLSFLAWLRALSPQDTGWPARVSLAAASGASFLLAMLSKEAAAVMLPAVLGLVVIRRWPELDGARRRLAGVLGGLVALVGLLFVVRGKLGTVFRRYDAEMMSRITLGETDSALDLPLIVLRALAEHARMLLWPDPLFAARRFSVPDSPLDPAVLAGAVVATALVAGVVLLWRRSRVASLGLAWFGIMLLPLLNVVPLTFWLVAERFAYVPLAGLALAVGAGAERAWAISGRARPVILAAGVLVASAWTLVTVRQNRVWESNLTLWENALANDPRSFLALHGLGVAADIDGDLERAEELLRRSLEVKPDYVDPRYALSYVLYKRAVATPRHDPSRQRHFNEAIGYARQYQSRRPQDHRSYVVEGNALFQQARLDEAVLAYREALERQPDDDDVRINLANALVAVGYREQQPSERCAEVLEVLPETDDYRILRLRGHCLGVLGDTEGALDASLRSLELAPAETDPAWLSRLRTEIESLERRLGS